MTSIRIGVCGIGSIGRRHARLISRRPELSLAMYDATYRPEGIAANAAIAGSFEELLDLGLDALVVATPEAWHVRPAITACHGGIPVLVEKPVAETSGEARQLATVASATGTAVLVGYVLRHHRAFALIHSLLDAGTIGSVVSFQVSLGAYETLRLARNRFDIAAQNRLFLDYSHEWDYLQWLLGPVHRVVAAATTVSGRERIETPNVVDALLEMASGVTGTVHLDYVQEGAGRICTLVGDRGALRADLGRGEIQVRINGEAFERSHRVDEPIDDAFDRQLDHFLAVVAGDARPRVTVEDGIQAIEVGEALVASVASQAWTAVTQ